ncbi:NAD(P)-binding domain-containing protein [Planococcus sp. A6]|uniref:FAD-dependent oxidoreductase n=1 Tax=Planococcus sp. A6 TaxID=2992760 RepID=UPI00237C3BEA|nr:FAD-dependent oxidoreductase [Planococcus sp. A6]MDE0582321.1 NAD(P)-binding domain-containing protein [Planococcus sp. A6]
MNTQTNCCSATPQRIQIERIKNTAPELPVVVIGAGPIGLAAAAHLSLAGEKFLVLEAGDRIGHHVLQWGHVRLFSPWQYNIDKAARALLDRSGWNAPGDDKLPTGAELVEDYLMKLAAVPEIEPYIRLNARVSAISRKHQDKMKTANREHQPFVIYVETEDAEMERIEAKAVIDATGTWGQPNPLQADGVWTQSERRQQERIFYGIPDLHGKDRERFAGKQVAVIGGGHSAINTLLDLAALEDAGHQVKSSWILRKPKIEDVYGGEADDALEARGELGARVHELVDSGRVEIFTPFRIEQVSRKDGKLSLMGDWQGKIHSIEAIDEIIVNTGSRPDFSFLKELRLKIDNATESIEALAPLIDPNVHSCGTVRPHGEKELRQPEQGFYIAGMKSYGRAPTFLMATGYEQVRSIVAYINGNIEASEKVELELPETGVCSSGVSKNGRQPIAIGGCC